MLVVLRDAMRLRIAAEVDAVWRLCNRAITTRKWIPASTCYWFWTLASRLRAPLAVRVMPACAADLKSHHPAHLLPRHIGHELKLAALVLTHGACVPNDRRELAHVVPEHGEHPPQHFWRSCHCACWSVATPFVIISASPTSCWRIRTRCPRAQGHARPAYPQRERLLAGSRLCSRWISAPLRRRPCRIPNSHPVVTAGWHTHLPAFIGKRICAITGVL